MLTVRTASRRNRIRIPSSLLFSLIPSSCSSFSSASPTLSFLSPYQSSSSSSSSFYASRRFITSFLSLSSDNLKHSHRERRLIKFPNYHVYNVVANVNDYKYFVPWCVDSRILQRNSPSFMEAQLAVGFQIFSERYTSDIVLEPQTKIIVHAKQTQLFHYLTNEWSFQPGPHPDYDTWLSFKVDFQFRSMLYAQASHIFFDEVVSKMVAAFERRCEVTWDPKLYPQFPSNNNGILQQAPAEITAPLPVTKIMNEQILPSPPSSSTSSSSSSPSSFPSTIPRPLSPRVSVQSTPSLPPLPSTPIISRKDGHPKERSSSHHHKVPPPLRGSVWL